MAIPIPIPDFMAAARLPSIGEEFAGGMTKGMGTLMALRHQQIQEQALRQQMATQQLAQQEAQERLKGLPLKLQTEQQQKEQDLRKSIQAATLQQQQIKKGLEPDVKNPLTLYNYGKNLYDQNPNNPLLPIVGKIISNAVTPKSGISIGKDAAGQMSVQIGGQQAFPGPSPFGTPLVNPVTKAARGQKGATYVDSETGKMYSTPTVQQTTKLQQTVLGDKQLKNIVDIITKDIDETDFFNPKSHVESWAAPLLKYTDPEAAQKRSNILGIENKAVAAGERLMTITNAPRTEKYMEQAIAIFRPEVGEFENTYKKRVASNMAVFMMNSNVAKEALNKGAPIGEMPYKMVQLAPRSFMDHIHPRYEYVKNPNYTGPEISSVKGGAPAAAPAAPAAAPAAPKYTQEDLEFTAKKHGITIEELKRRLGEQ